MVVAAGGCDFYPGSRASSPSFSFAVTELRVAGEGDLLAQVERLRKALAAEGLFEPQKRLPRPSLPRCIGVVSGEGGKARDDVLAGLRRRGWAGRIVWAFAPVQDRHAAPAITRALQDLAACEEVEVIVVARGGGSLADLFAFCDETLCRTVALLRVPVIASRRPPHRPHADRRRRGDRVLDPDPCRRGRRARQLRRGARGAARRSPRGWSTARGWRSSSAPACSRGCRARPPTTSRATARGCTSTRASCARAAAAQLGLASRHTSTTALVLERKARAAAGAEHVQRGRDLERLALALAAHEPQRTLERGYALVEDPSGEPVTSAAAAREHAELTLRLHDGNVSVRPQPYGGES